MRLYTCLVVQLVRSVLRVALLSSPRMPKDGKKQTFWVIPHTHWEGAVFKTREEYLDMGLPTSSRRCGCSESSRASGSRSTRWRMCGRFSSGIPAEEADFRRFLAEGRLQLAGALDVMPDVNMPGGETFVRQMQYGKGYYRDKLGVDVTTGWLLDTFGHHAQMPQLLAQGGYKSFWFFRGVPRQDFPSEFFWEGIDGTRIAAFWLPHGYGLVYGAPNETAGFARVHEGPVRRARSELRMGRTASARRASTSASPRSTWPRASRSSIATRRPRSICGWPCPPISRRSSPDAPTGPSSRAS